VQRKKLQALRHTGVAIEINGSQVFEHIYALFIFLTRVLEKKNLDCFWILFS
jgi:hypothetical protein